MVWLGPNVDVPAGASSSDFTVDAVRFQNWVSFAIAGPPTKIPRTPTRVARFIIPPFSRPQPRVGSRPVSARIMAPRSDQDNARYDAGIAGSRRLNSSAPSSIAAKRKAMTSRG